MCGGRPRKRPETLTSPRKDPPQSQADTPGNLHAEPQTLNPKPLENPEPLARNPKTLNPKTGTLDPARGREAARRGLQRDLRKDKSHLELHVAETAVWGFRVYLDPKEPTLFRVPFYEFFT